MTKIFYPLFPLLFLLNSLMAQEEIRLHSVSTARQPGGDNGYTLDGIRMQNTSRPKLGNPDYFSEDGIYPKYVVITDGYDQAGSLEAIAAAADVDLFFFGMFNKLETTLVPFSDAEIDTLHVWSKRGGKLIIGASANAINFGYDLSVLNAKWGFDCEALPPNNLIFPTEAGAGSLIFEGPFGSVASASQGGGGQGYLSSFSEDAVVLGEGAQGFPMLVLDCVTLDLIVSDNDAYTDLSGISSGPDIQNDNDRFWLNTIAYMNQLQGPPVVAQDGNALSAGSYLSYQWMLDGLPVAGATDSSLVLSEGGSYSVAVSMSCGCDATSEPFFATVSGVGNRLPEVELSAVPNPVFDHLSIQVRAPQATDLQLFVTDAQGRQVERQVFGNTDAFDALLDLRSLPAGVYSLTVGTKDGMVARQFVKQ